MLASAIARVYVLLFLVFSFHSLLFSASFTSIQEHDLFSFHCALTFADVISKQLRFLCEAPLLRATCLPSWPFHEACFVEFKLLTQNNFKLCKATMNIFRRFRKFQALPAVYRHFNLPEPRNSFLSIF